MGWVTRRNWFLQVKDLPKVIQEENLIVEYLSDEMIGRCVLSFANLRQKFGRDDHLAMLVRNVEKITRVLSSHACN